MTEAISLTGQRKLCSTSVPVRTVPDISMNVRDEKLLMCAAFNIFLTYEDVEYRCKWPC